MSGISFSPPLVLALLAGHKSQTRRIIRPCTDPEVKPGDVVVSWPADQVVRSGLRFRPPWAIGDRLYVKEGIERGEMGEIVYRADGQSVPGSQWGWKPRSLPHRYMPKRLARLWITVTDVRIERLHDISAADCYAEGIERPDAPSFGSEVCRTDNARAAFCRLWNGLHDKDGERWDDNPWLVALTFTVERTHPMTDKPPAEAIEAWNPISDCPPEEYVLFRFAQGSSRDKESPNVAVGKLHRDGDIWLTCQWAGSRADDDPIGWLHIPRPTPAVPDEGLVERLREGVKEIGLHEDNNTELFDIDGANEVMWEAANALATLSPSHDSRLADDLRAIANEMRQAVAYGMSWISHSEAEGFANRIEHAALRSTPSADELVEAETELDEAISEVEALSEAMSLLGRGDMVSPIDTDILTPLRRARTALTAHRGGAK